MEVESAALASNQHGSQGFELHLASRVRHIAAANTSTSTVFLSTDSNASDWIGHSYLCLGGVGISHIAAASTSILLCAFDALTV